MVRVTVSAVGGNALELGEMDEYTLVSDLEDTIARHWEVPACCLQLISAMQVVKGTDQLAAHCERGCPNLSLTMVVSLEGAFNKLSTGSALTKTEVLNSLERFRPQADERLISKVCTQMEDPHRSVRASALSTLLALAERGNEHAMSEMIPRVSHADPHVRRAAVRALSNLAEKGSATVVAALGACVDDQDRETRLAAAKSIGIVAQKNDENAINFLSYFLDDQDYRVRQTAVQSLSSVAGRGDARVAAAVSSEMSSQANWNERIAGSGGRRTW